MTFREVTWFEISDEFQRRRANKQAYNDTQLGHEMALSLEQTRMVEEAKTLAIEKVEGMSKPEQIKGIRKNTAVERELDRHSLLIPSLQNLPGAEPNDKSNDDRTEGDEYIGNPNRVNNMRKLREEREQQNG